MVDNQRTNDQQYIGSLANEHQTVTQAVDSTFLLDRLPAQTALIQAAYTYFSRQSDNGITHIRAAEWLLDNYYLVRQTQEQIQQDLPASYYVELPKLASGVFKHYPRVYALVHHIVCDTQANLEVQRFIQLVEDYQQVIPLTMGEVWALPIMWRFCLLESLAQAVGRLCGLLPDDADMDPALQFNFTVDEADYVAIVIHGLRSINDVNWQDFFETVSRVEQTLRHDPAQIYPDMDFDSRNRYRSVIEDLAKASRQDEVSVAQCAVALAQDAYDHEADSFEVRDDWYGLQLPADSHVGHYLYGDGRSALEQRMGYSPQGVSRIQRWHYNYPGLLYFGAIGLLTTLIGVLVTMYAVQASGLWLLWVVIPVLVAIPVISAVVHLVNWTVTHTIPPRVLPKIDFQEGIPASCRTVIVVPSLLSNPGTVRSLLSQIEQHYLRNVDENLSFALLTDFVDAPQQTMPDDEPLLTAVVEGIEGLNRQYPAAPFYLCHRPRLWNAGESTWMGWERKRGKLHEFNQFLLTGKDESYSTIVGDVQALHRIRYVITLDADTILPYDSARRLVGTLAHPLNRAQFDAVGNVVAGYTVLQPRIEIMPTSVNETHFTRLFAQNAGVDLYTLAVSDVYQDLFGEGIYAGKGIYDVRAFERSLTGCVPVNTLLSHDLFEGINGRSALVTDVILYEDYPPSYPAYVRRMERWVRGDWQLLPWLLARYPCKPKQPHKTLTLLDRWKITDNLRRSILTPALVVLFVTGWLWLPGSPWLWTLLGLGLSAVLFLTEAVDVSLRSLNRTMSHGVRRTLQDCLLRWLFWLSVVPYDAWYAVRAIAITLTRLLVTGRHRLQWVTAATMTTLVGKKLTPRTALTQMWGLPAMSLALGLLIIWLNPTALIPASLVLVLWALAPVLIAHTSQPITHDNEQLSAPQVKQLRRLARHTWLYFEHFVGPDDHWLPPDHYQQAPREVVAHRTSPTNTGLYLLSVLSAYDLGYLNAIEMSFRLRFTFDTLAQLERYRGHFRNWIDTRNLHPLNPAYISTVDSGNLAASLIAVKQGCLDMSQQKLLRWERWEGLIDTLCVLADALMAIKDVPNDALTEFQDHIIDICEQIENVQDDPTMWLALLQSLSTEDRPRLDQYVLHVMNTEIDTIGSETISDLRVYIQLIQNHIDAMQGEFNTLAPWFFARQQALQLFTGVDVSPALQQAWDALQASFRVDVTLSEASDVYQTIKDHLETLQTLLSTETTGDDHAKEAAITQASDWCKSLLFSLNVAQTSVKSIQDTYDTIAQEAHKLVAEMDFTFLFDSKRHVFHIGFNLETNQLDPNAYDLLASEACIASLVAIAKRDIPQRHWLHLARPLARLDGKSVLLSWSGTMFEYLMPSLLIRNYSGTLLTQSCQAVVDAQIDYGRQHDVPWGISESGYYAFDQHMNHQYQAFGVPGLGLKRGLSDDLVMTPYASVLALPFRPAAVLKNLQALKSLHALSRYGLYEAIDYTHLRLKPGQTSAIVQSHMAHHQGMIMVALLNYLSNETMVNRFHADPWVQSVELLLQEKIPRNPQAQPIHDAQVAAQTPTTEVAIYPWQVAHDTPAPHVHYLSNGQYRTLITNTGGGYSQWKDIALTRWRADTTLDDWGYWIYVQDVDSGEYWSVGTQPTGRVSNRQDIRFYPHMVEFLRHDHDIALDTRVTVATDDDIDVRRINLVNESDRQRHLRLISYGEVVLAPLDTDRRHPAFVKLFVESEYIQEHNALLFRRRPRSSEENPVFLLHMLVVNAEQKPTPIYETDRAQFIGRNRNLRQPAALEAQAGLTQTVGATLDPVMSLGQDIYLAPYASYQLAYITTAAATRAEVLQHAQQYRRWPAIENAFSQSEKQARRELQELDLTVADLEAMQRVLSLLLYPQSEGRAQPDILAANRLGQSALWRSGISGDYPMLLVEIQDDEQDMLLDQLLRAHTYWRRHGVSIDLIILNQQTSSYGQPVNGYVRRLIRRTHNEDWLNQRGGIFVLQRDQISDEEYILLQTTARVILNAEQGGLATQAGGMDERPVRLPHFSAMVDPSTLTEPIPPLPRPQDLLFDNNWGGFSLDGREYVMYLTPSDSTPAPWVNVIANPEFGFLVSESGLGATWALNSGENRLTTWRNDPVSDRPSEAVYLRDEETAEIWSPTPQPAPADAPYLTQHGAGYSAFTHHSHGLKQRLRVFAAHDAPVKVVQLRLENCWQRPRRITATYYAEWVLGTDRETTQQYLVPVYQPEYNALFVRNPYSMEFSERVAFMAVSKPPHGLTTDRTEFLGRLGNYQRPAALERIGLDGRVHAGLDPCAALQLHLDLPPGASEDVYFLIGQGDDQDAAQQLIHSLRKPEHISDAWQAVQQHWNDILGVVTAATPDPALNLLLNRWLLYQTIVSRLWGRSAFYQSSGAYGFRDQLQDVIALLHTRPDLAREHILRAARHQFEEGDVLHWWHPPSGRGVRTRISDDLLWLPYVTARYVAATGDTDILDETIPFLHGRRLPPDEDEHYDIYKTTSESYTLYDHCRRAIRAASTTGQHDLPLIGSGDWNDGMNRIGIKGSGESIWLGWFLYTILTDFSELCQRTDHADHTQQYQQQAAALQQALEANGWDGNWYRRAYFDDGTPIGSVNNEECRIDAIAQAWSVLSGAAAPERAQQAMESLLQHLVRWDDRLILLLTPPFDKTRHDPGYIKGYVPGIRENGGQYTHAALWAIWAFAELGNGDLAYDLFQLINPIYRADTPQGARRYRVEPYVVAADVYGVQPHVGRGGWTWYTGSAAWMYRLGVEMILGLQPTASGLRVAPCIPSSWQTYTVTYRHHETTYHIRVENRDGGNQGVQHLTLDGQRLSGNVIPWLDDGDEHLVVAQLEGSIPG